MKEERYGELRVLGEAGKCKSNHRQLLVQCDCGTQFVVRRDNLLRRGPRRCVACACKLGQRPVGLKVHAKSGSQLHKLWKWMRKRCNNPAYLARKNYGGRGISVDARWDIFQNFYDDMAPTYRPNLQLERIDNDGPYSRENCRWATWSEQQRNKRTNRHIDTPAGRMLLCEAAEYSKIAAATIRSRLRMGWAAERLFDPVRELRR